MRNAIHYFCVLLLTSFASLGDSSVDSQIQRWLKQDENIESLFLVPPSPAGTKLSPLYFELRKLENREIYATYVLDLMQRDALSGKDAFNAVAILLPLLGGSESQLPRATALVKQLILNERDPYRQGNMIRYFHHYGTKEDVPFLLGLLDLNVDIKDNGSYSIRYSWIYAVLLLKMRVEDPDDYIKRALAVSREEPEIKRVDLTPPGANAAPAKNSEEVAVSFPLDETAEK